jgi:hypothetical protein
MMVEIIAKNDVCERGREGIHQLIEFGSKSKICESVGGFGEWPSIFVKETFGLTYGNIEGIVEGKREGRERKAERLRFMRSRTKRSLYQVQGSVVGIAVWPFEAVSSIYLRHHRHNLRKRKEQILMGNNGNGR